MYVNYTFGGCTFNVPMCCYLLVILHRLRRHSRGSDSHSAAKKSNNTIKNPIGEKIGLGNIRPGPSFCDKELNYERRGVLFWYHQKVVCHINKNAGSLIVRFNANPFNFLVGAYDLVRSKIGNSSWLYTDTCFSTLQVFEVHVVLLFLQVDQGIWSSV